MAVPKFKKSRANTRTRRSAWKANNPKLQQVVVDGQSVLIPRRLVRAAKEGLIDVEQFS
ncbi:50S ribosomal protein L32 [Corynebacterium otitidis]|uniref:Large ribosomal subunit protein bL32 n=1 Tax=Corynebacterium otitidis ATCC 51513 TaxID=883169 RepID=I7LBP0_9CORY|nr:50S ribosomal protein L32 [Corynebacterium otitidis]EJZ82047.1 50S ribosomal protein L32 [Corynebacterium otitidis ATCC 51513]KKO83288.1 50S ribosomal protein L32 [Corynebacterium otitidis]CCI83259.1 50S ribosomal protein L32 [Corynebacterium otitidis ATCC 51513]